MAGALPLEIHHQIIDFLAVSGNSPTHRQKALLHCTLISWAWTHRSRIHLYRRIHIDSLGWGCKPARVLIQQLRRTLASSPLLACLVEEIVLSANIPYSDRTGQYYTTLWNAPLVLGAFVPRLRTLTFNYGAMSQSYPGTRAREQTLGRPGPFHPFSSGYLRTPLRSLRSLKIDAVVFHGASEFLRLLLAIPDLRELALCNVCMPSSHQGLPVRLVTNQYTYPPLDRLCIISDTEQNVDILRGRFLSTQMLFWHLIAMVAPTLKSLVVSEGLFAQGVDHAGSPWTQFKFDLSHVVTIVVYSDRSHDTRQAGLTNEVSMRSLPQRVFAFLQAADARSLRNLHFFQYMLPIAPLDYQGVPLLGRIPMDTGSTLKDTLVRAGLPSLRTLSAVECITIVSNGADKAKQLRARLSALASACWRADSGTASGTLGIPFTVAPTTAVVIVQHPEPPSANTLVWVEKEHAGKTTYRCLPNIRARCVRGISDITFMEDLGLLEPNGHPDGL